MHEVVLEDKLRLLLQELWNLIIGLLHRKNVLGELAFKRINSYQKEVLGLLVIAGYEENLDAILDDVPPDHLTELLLELLLVFVEELRNIEARRLHEVPYLRLVEILNNLLDHQVHEIEQVFDTTRLQKISRDQLHIQIHHLLQIQWLSLLRRSLLFNQVSLVLASLPLFQGYFFS